MDGVLYTDLGPDSVVRVERYKAVFKTADPIYLEVDSTTALYRAERDEAVTGVCEPSGPPIAPADGGAVRKKPWMVEVPTDSDPCVQ